MKTPITMTPIGVERTKFPRGYSLFRKKASPGNVVEGRSGVKVSFDCLGTGTRPSR